MNVFELTRALIDIESITGNEKAFAAGADIGATTTVRFTLQNFSASPKAVPGSTIFELHDGAGPAIGTAEVRGAPIRANALCEGLVLHVNGGRRKADVSVHLEP